MEAIKKTILITGSNKGIGFGIIKGLLAKNKNYQLILTSRNADLGQKSLLELKNEFPSNYSNVDYLQLDINNVENVNNCFKQIKDKYGQIDIWVNNAAVATKGPEFNIDVFNYTFPTNVYSTINLTEMLITEQIIRKSGKIIMVGSSSGNLSRLKSESLKQRFLKADISTQDLLDLANNFKQSIEQGTIDKNGWVTSAYSASKMIINTYPRALSRKQYIIDNQIGVYSCHPGWVRTDMAGPAAALSIEEGVVTPIYVIELPDGIIPELQAKYFDKCKVKELAN